MAQRWGLKNFWLAEGNTFGILLAGGVGHYLSEWIINGEPSIDLFEVDPRRFGAYANQEYTAKKNVETYGHVFDIHYPNLEMPSARPSKTSPCYQRMSEAGAVWGQKYGWERANWFANSSQETHDELSFHRSNDFEAVARECHVARSACALIDFTPFAKFDVRGEGATAFLNHLVANRLPKNGHTRLTHALYPSGGVRSELTISRLSEYHFYVVTPAWAERFDEDLLQKNCPKNGSVRITNITEQKGTFVITGPNSRALLQSLSDDDLSQSAFPWFGAQKINIKNVGEMLALRVSYIGELGWELHHDSERQVPLYDALMADGKKLGIKPIGMRAIDSLRLEKSYRGWNLGLSSEYTPLESGLGRFVDFDKGEFTGREALIKQKENGIIQKMITLSIEKCNVQPISNAPLFDEANDMIDRITSGGFGHTLGKVIALAYVAIEHTKPKQGYQAEILGKCYPASIINDSPYDPNNTVQFR